MGLPFLSGYYSKERFWNQVFIYLMMLILWLFG